MEDKKIIVVIPTYNERENIQGLIQSIMNLGLDIGVVVVDDNSPDGTAGAVEELCGRYPEVRLLRRVNRKGLGSAYVDGFKDALLQGADLILGMDADFSHEPASIPDFLRAIKENDVVVGSRYLKGVSVVNWPLHRLMLSIFANRYARFVTGLPVTDATSGFICYRSEVLRGISLDNIESDGYSFLVEMKYRIFKAGFKMAEIPIIFAERRQGRSKLSFKAFIESAIMVWRLRFGWYKK